MVFPHPERSRLIEYLKSLRDRIIREFETFESIHRFERRAWQYQGEGGGEISLLHGDHFEKAAVNWSGVGGSSFPMVDGEGAFFATGISLITHMSNPHAPTVHMNIRFIETERKFWFGGGFDLTPMGFVYEEDTRHFHEVAKSILDPFGPEVYDTFSANAKHYFYIPHRKKERGVGGIFFDHYNTENFAKDLELWQSVGDSFLDAIIPIYKRRINESFLPQDREEQLRYRGHYAEFNLAYDRGTQFGFKSGGNPDAILCSMPPLASWK